MAQQRGTTVKMLIDTESTFRTFPASVDAFVLPFVSESLRLSRNLIESKTIRSNRNPQMPVRGNVDVAGDISFEMAWQYGRLFKHVFGGYTVSAGATSTTHTFTIGDLPAGMMIQKYFPDITTATYFQYNGCKVNQFKFAIKPEGFIESSVAVIGAKETTTTTDLDSSPTDLGHEPFDGFGATISRAGTQLAVVTAVDFTLDNQLDADTYVIDGTGYRYSLPEGFAAVSGNITALFTDDILYNLALNYTEVSLTVLLYRGTAAGTDSNEKVTFYVDECILKPQAPVVSGPGGVLVELPFVGFYNDATAASALRMVLNCAQATF